MKTETLYVEENYTLETVELVHGEADSLHLLPTPIDDEEMGLMELASGEIRWPVTRETALKAQAHIGETVQIRLIAPWGETSYCG